MHISVHSAVGTGNTTLSAFDHALKNVGVLDYNLIPLSSVIPSGATVEQQKYFHMKEQTVGKRLYVVMANNRSNDLDTVIGAGLGWYFFENGGVFVEHEAEGHSIAAVEDILTTQIHESIMDLCVHRGKRFSDAHVQTSLSICPAIPTPRCALTIAVFQSEGW
jgi:arginine decarboxylase